MKQTMNTGGIVIDGIEVPYPPTKHSYHFTAWIGNKIYCDGYEYKNGKWKKTLMSLLHYRLLT